MLFLNQWRLPLLFVISGMGTWFAFRKRSPAQFAKERVRRLLIPLLFGCLFIVPPQIYFEYLDRGTFTGSYLFDFWPVEVFTKGLYKFNPDGALSWHHLWFVLYLFIFSIVLIPAFAYLKRHPEAWLARVAKRLASSRAGLLAFAIPLLLLELLLERKFPMNNALAGDWYALTLFGSLFFLGFLLLTAKDTFWDNATRNRKTYLVGGLAGFSLLMVNWYVLGSYEGKYEIYCVLKTFNMWSWILALFGYAAAYLNKPSRALSYANEAVYPFYIIHQTIIIGLGYYMKNLSMGFLPKFTIMAAATFGLTWLVYELGVRRWNAMRFLFGMKSKDRCRA